MLGFSFDKGRKNKSDIPQQMFRLDFGHWHSDGVTSENKKKEFVWLDTESGNRKFHYHVKKG